MSAARKKPDDLHPEARAWVDEIQTSHDLTPTGRVYVREAARAMSIIAEARETRRSLVVAGRYKDTEKASTWLTVERAARADLLRCLAALDLDQEAR